MSLTPFGVSKRVPPRILPIPWQSVVRLIHPGPMPRQELAMFPSSLRLPLRLPRRLKVLFWRLADRLRKPRSAPPALPAEEPLDLPAFLRRDRHH
jgi:hypothetical protein